MTAAAEVLLPKGVAIAPPPLEQPAIVAMAAAVTAAAVALRGVLLVNDL